MTVSRFHGDLVLSKFKSIWRALVGDLETLSTDSEPFGLKVSWIKNKIQKFITFFEENIDLPPTVAVKGEPVFFFDKFVYLGSAIVSGGNHSWKSIDVWELHLLRWIPLTTVFWGVNICAEEQRSGCFGLWFSLFYYMAVKLGTLEPVNVAVWFFL